MSIILSMQQKVLGGYLNAPECGLLSDRSLIMSETLTEDLFDQRIHKAVVRAINKLRSENLEATDYTVLELLQKYNMPSTVDEEKEYMTLMSTFAITYKSMMQYINSIVNYKLRGK